MTTMLLRGRTDVAGRIPFVPGIEVLMSIYLEQVSLSKKMTISTPSFQLI